MYVRDEGTGDMSNIAAYTSTAGSQAKIWGPWVGGEAGIAPALGYRAVPPAPHVIRPP
jgi:hypothetical protein